MADWWARGAEPLLDGKAEVGTNDLADDGVTTAKIAALNVTSECISANAIQRTVMVPLPAQAAGTTAPMTSAFAIWTAKTAVVINNLALWMQSSWVMSTAQSTPLASVFTTGATDVGTVYIGSTDPPARGTAKAITVASAALGAGKSLAFGCAVASSSGMVQPAMSLQIDYVSSE